MRHAVHCGPNMLMPLKGISAGASSSGLADKREGQRSHRERVSIDLRGLAPRLKTYAAAMTPPLPTLELVASYEAALYEVEGDVPALLRIGQVPPHGWLDQLGARSVTLITAWNPFSQALDEAINLERLDR